MHTDKCKAWLEAIEFALDDQPSPEWEYGPTMPPFNYCPFCGERLVKDVKGESNDGM